MNFITIPVRLASSRFPDKVIQDLHGKPLMQWIWEACSQVVGSDSVYFNTPDSKLVAIAESFGAQAVLTDTYNCVLDQCSEATRKIKEFLPFYDTVTVVQGDEPMTTPEMIWKSIIGYYNSDCAGSCLYKKITLEEAKDINTVRSWRAYLPLSFQKYCSWDYS
jgi:3-deoxy-manno-octulosonate cytidylyltransferase (CMP-KDO synthetase)